MATVDELIGNTDAFPVLRHWNYLNHAGISPLPHCVAEAVRKFATAYESNAYLGDVGFGEIEKCRKSIATLINAEPVEVAFQKNTGEAISTVAFGLDWAKGDRVVTAAVEYPANVYPWMELSRRHGVEVIMVPERDQPDGSRAVNLAELLAAAEHPRCRMVALSHVQYASGQRMPIEQIGAFCRQRGKYVCVDAIQSLGALPVDVKKANIDFLAAGSQKWLLGPVGTAFVFIRKELMPQVRPLAIGAYSVVDPDNYGELNYTLQPDNRRHECGTPGLASVMGVAASIDMLFAAGKEAIAVRVKHLTDRLVTGLRGKGYRIKSPRGGEDWSGIVAFLPPGEADLKAIARRLRVEHRIEVVLRENRLRAAPHFYNTDQQMDQLVAALD